MSGIGTVIIPVKGPYLRVGTWKLLADSSQGAADALSVPFTVRPCIDCDTALADSILADWKAAAATSGEAMGNLCRASAAYGRLTQAKKAGKFLRTAANVSPVLLVRGRRIRWRRAPDVGVPVLHTAGRSSSWAST